MSGGDGASARWGTEGISEAGISSYRARAWFSGSEAGSGMPALPRSEADDRVEALRATRFFWDDLVAEAGYLG